ncbi:MAG: FG-GAP-like repeat-containing protein [Gammaproteobacteria bacterium]
MRILSLSILMLACGAASGQDFDEFVIDAGFRVEQQILVADLYGDSRRQILIAGRDDAHVQHVAIYSLDSIREPGAKPLITLNPGPDLIAYDVGRLGGDDALFFIEPGRVLRYSFEDGNFVEFIKIRSIYGQQRSGDILPIDFFRDINGDGHDDLIVPDTAGYRIRLQKTDGSLGEETLLEESSRMTVTGDVVSFESRPLFSGDVNFDGLADLGVWRGNTLRVYPQLPDHRYQSEPDIVQLGLGLLSEAEFRALEAAAGSVDQRGLSQKIIVSIEDHNGDNLPDILIESTMSMGVFDKRNTLSLHLGRQQGESLVYNEAEDALLASDGLQYGLVTTDIDGDGLQDLVVRKVRLSFSRVIRALISGNVSLRLSFFRMTPDGGYGEEPNYVTRTKVHFSMTSGQIDIPAVAVADFDGDGLKDLMIQTRPGQLSVSHGIANENLFTDESTNIEVDLPRNGDLVASEDVDNDGRSDLIMRYTAADGEQAAHLVRILIARPASSAE